MDIADVVLVRHCLLFAVLIACVYTDLARGKIYNWCTLTGIVCGLLVNFVLGGLHDGGLLGMNLAGSAAGMAAVLAVFAWPYVRGGVAAGDVKLMVAVGAIGGVSGFYVVYALFYSALIGALMAVLALLWRGKLWDGVKGSVRFTFTTGHASAAREGDSEGPQQPSASGVTIPYGFAIAIGSIIAWYIVALPTARGALAALRGM